MDLHEKGCHIIMELSRHLCDEKSGRKKLGTSTDAGDLDKKSFVFLGESFDSIGGGRR